MEEEISIWDKKQSDLTVRENTEMLIGVAVVVALIPVAIELTTLGVKAVLQHRRMKKLAREFDEKLKEIQNPEDSE